MEDTARKVPQRHHAGLNRPAIGLGPERGLGITDDDRAIGRYVEGEAIESAAREIAKPNRPLGFGPPISLKIAAPDDDGPVGRNRTGTPGRGYFSHSAAGSPTKARLAAATRPNADNH
jgi:hypothetical protein